VVLLATGLVLAGLYRLRVHRITRRLNALFEERLAERLRIAHDLHDTLLQGLVSVSMQLHVAGEQLPPGSPARLPFGRVQRLMERVIVDGRDAVNDLRSAPLDSGDLGEALARFWDETAMGGGPELCVIVEGTPRPLRPVTQDEVYWIGREALLNALRHARAQRVEVELEWGPRGIRMLVRDDGVGMDPELPPSGRDGHFGLSGMRERAERIGGRLTVRSRKDAGTEVALWVKGALAFRSTRGSELLGRLRNRLAGRKPSEPRQPAPGQSA
jgi:signal transduction histidine kinase